MFLSVCICNEQKGMTKFCNKRGFHNCSCQFSPRTCKSILIHDCICGKSRKKSLQCRKKFSPHLCLCLVQSNILNEYQCDFTNCNSICKISQCKKRFEINKRIQYAEHLRGFRFSSV